MLVPSSFPPSFYVGSAIIELEERSPNEGKKKRGGCRGETEELPGSGLYLTWQNNLNERTKETPPIPDT